MAFDPLATLDKVNPALYKKMKDNNKAAFSEGAIPIKYKLLLAMALDAAEGATDGVTAVTQLALNHGATKEEIAEVLNVLHYVCGGGSIYTASMGMSKVE